MRIDEIFVHEENVELKRSDGDKTEPPLVRRAQTESFVLKCHSIGVIELNKLMFYCD